MPLRRGCFGDCLLPAAVTRQRGSVLCAGGGDAEALAVEGGARLSEADG